MGEKMYQTSREYKDKIDGLCTRYYAGIVQLKDMLADSSWLEQKITEINEQFKDDISSVTDEFVTKMEILADESCYK